MTGIQAGVVGVSARTGVAVNVGHDVSNSPSGSLKTSSVNTAAVVVVTVPLVVLRTPRGLVQIK